uniref:Uncharacterized protein n=1 Tax=Astyanax mexicanus TaxID=7994 RepID=A0A3B1ICY0_ASTMX
MKLKPFVLLLFTVAVCFFRDVKGGKVLVWPTEGSHWTSLEPLLEAMIDRGHTVTVLVPSSTLYMDRRESSPFTLIHFGTSISKKDVSDFVRDVLEFSMNKAHSMNALQKHLRFHELFSRRQHLGLSYCDGVLKSPAVMNELQQEQFSIVLVDPFCPCGDLLAEVLGVPFVVTQWFSFGRTLERMCGQTPAPPSYVPGFVTMTDRMNFFERVVNTMFYLAQDVLTLRQWKTYDLYYTECLGKSYFVHYTVQLSFVFKKNFLKKLYPSFSYATWAP